MRSICLLLPLLFVQGLSFGQGPKISPELQKADLKATLKVIVQFDQDPTDAQHQKVLSRGGTFRATLHSVKAGAYSIPASALSDLANDPGVVHISLDHKISAKLDYTTSAINAPAAWNSGWDGSGIGVAVIDSGISSDTDLTAKGSGQRLSYKQDFTGGDGSDHY
ncbi:MAG: hypothetical protein WB992_12175, partial [Bryobacteraceae bacterium]